MNQKYKINYVYFSYENFTKDNFSKEIRKNFHLNTTYSILIKISSNSNTIFKMSGPQIGINLGSEHNENYYSDIYETIKERIELVYESYSYIDTIETVLLVYSIVTPLEELKLKNVNRYTFHKRLINIKNVKKDFNQNFLPLTMDSNRFGVKVLEEDKSEILNSILEKNKFLNINEKNEIEIHFFTNQTNKNKKIILSEKMSESTQKELKEENNNNKIVNRYIFDFKTKIFIKQVIDIDKYNYCSRKIGNLTLKFDNNKVMSYTINNKLEPIKPVITTYFDRNNKIGTFDLETFLDEDGISKVYALGFFTTKDKDPVLFFIDNNLNSDFLIEQCIDNMLVDKYNNFIFYAHNFSKYDVIFLYNILLKANERKGYEHYKLKTTMRDSDIIRLDLSIKVKSIENDKKDKTIKISFRDSMDLLNYSLEYLTRQLNINLKKGIFPHNFVNRRTINYIGNKPDISFYIKSKKVFTDENKNDYYSIPLDNWNLKNECLSYLKNDILSLFKVMEEFNRLINLNFNQQVFESLTITRLALNIFYKRYYNIKNKPIPYINKTFLFNFIKEGYYGGVTEVYKPYGENLVYLDINSLYPFAALNGMPGLNCEYIESLENNETFNLDNVFGFFQAKIKTNGQYIGLLPVRHNNKIVLPNGEFEGIWSSEELKYARDQGYKVSIIKGYNFNKIEDTFKDYILDLYNKKKNSEGFLKTIYKSLLNNFLGRFGLNFVKPVTETVNNDKREFILTTREVYSEKNLNNNKFIITYNPIINKFICENHGVDYLKVLEREYQLNLENKFDSFKDVSIAITAMVNSYARIHMNKLKLEILRNKGNIYYSDTDSLIIDKDSLNKKWLGEEIGKFKLVYEVKRGYFITNKTYCLVLNNGEIIVKSKGVSNNNLNEKEFINMYLYNKNIKAIKHSSSTDIVKSTVILEEKEIILSQNSYDKREKIYDESGIWKDTKTINIFNKKDIA